MSTYKTDSKLSSIIDLLFFFLNSRPLEYFLYFCHWTFVCFKIQLILILWEPQRDTFLTVLCKFASLHCFKVPSSKFWFSLSRKMYSLQFNLLSVLLGNSTGKTRVCIILPSGLMTQIEICQFHWIGMEEICSLRQTFQ